jgi:hypothetical protein
MRFAQAEPEKAHASSRRPLSRYFRLKAAVAFSKSRDGPILAVFKPISDDEMHDIFCVSTESIGILERSELCNSQRAHRPFEAEKKPIS